MVTSQKGREKALEELRQAAAVCTACDLYTRATQTVFGEGNPRAAIVLVGEQPGHEEDLAGRPFVGPAGRLLDEALARAGLDRDELYLTNAVKHFKWKAAEGGKRRIHERPRQGEVAACRPWFQQELWLIEPNVLVCLGATAARAALGIPVTIAAARGRILESSFGSPTVVTMHPSAILRTRDTRDRQAMMRRLVADLRQAARVAGKTVRRV
jgi:uracil-DNA glycosylase